MKTREVGKGKFSQKRFVRKGHCVAWWKTRRATPCYFFFYIPHTGKKKETSLKENIQKTKNPSTFSSFQHHIELALKSSTAVAGEAPRRTQNHQCPAVPAVHPQPRPCAAHGFRGLSAAQSSTQRGRFARAARLHSQEDTRAPQESPRLPL